MKPFWTSKFEKMVEIAGITTSYFAPAEGRPIAHLMMADGTTTEMPFEEAMKLLEAHRPEPSVSIDALERDAVTLWCSTGKRSAHRSGTNTTATTFITSTVIL